MSVISFSLTQEMWLPVSTGITRATTTSDLIGYKQMTSHRESSRQVGESLSLRTPVRALILVHL